MKWEDRHGDEIPTSLGAGEWQGGGGGRRGTGWGVGGGGGGVWGKARGGINGVNQILSK